MIIDWRIREFGGRGIHPVLGTGLMSSLLLVPTSKKKIRFSFVDIMKLTHIKVTLFPFKTQPSAGSNTIQ